MGPIETTKWLFLDSWYRGFWALLAFAMQMCLILVTGYAIAYHPLVYRGLKRLATVPKSTKQAVALTAFVAMVFSWINWGLGLIIGAVLARAIGVEFYKQRRPLHYAPSPTLKKLVFSGYLGDKRSKLGSKGGWYDFFFQVKK